MKQKKVLAMSMATIMAFASTGMVFADDVTDASKATGSVEGNGSIEGYADTDVFTVTLPTTSTINFKIDPQELLKATNSSDTIDTVAFGSADTGYGKKVLFQGDPTTAYTSTSADIAVVNKSTFDVDVNINAKVTGLTKEDDSKGYSIALTDSDDNFGSDTAMTLALTPTTYTLTDTTASNQQAGSATYLTDAEEGVTLTTTVAKSDNVKDAYTFDKSSGSYKYQLQADVSSIPFKAVKFNLAGTVNTTANWKNFSEDSSKALKVALTYSVTKHVDGPQVTIDNAGKITMSNLTSTANFASSIVLKGSTHTADLTVPSEEPTYDAANWNETNGGTLIAQLPAGYLSYYTGETVTVTILLSDGSTITSNCTFN